jgi:hypothetical protein
MDDEVRVPIARELLERLYVIFQVKFVWPYVLLAITGDFQ